MTQELQAEFFGKEGVRFCRASRSFGFSHITALVAAANYSS